MPASDSSLTLRDYLQPLRTRWWLILGSVVVLAAVGLVYGATRSRSYTAGTKLYISANSGLGTPSGVALATVADQATLLTSSAQDQRVAKALGFSGGIPASVSANQIGVTDFIEVTAKAASAHVAVEVANEFARQYELATTATAKAAAQTELGSYEKQYRALGKAGQAGATGQQLLSEIEQVRTILQATAGDATQVNPAVGASLSGAKTLEYTIAGALVGFIASALLAYMLQGMDPRLRSVSAAADVYPFPVLATVPHDPRIDDNEGSVVMFSPRSREAFRELRVGLELAANHEKYGVIAICSAMPSEGKTSVARGLALAYSEVGRSVAVLDLDLRRARLAPRFGVDSKQGVSDVIAGAVTIANVSHQVTVSVVTSGSKEPQPVGVDKRAAGFETEFALTVVPAGTTPPNPLAVMEDPRLIELIDELASKHDVVIIDTAPVVLVSDSVGILARADASVVVARSNVTDKRSAKRATVTLSRIHDVNVAGVVVNDLNTADAYGYGYAAAYGKYGYA